MMITTTTKKRDKSKIIVDLTISILFNGWVEHEIL